MSHVCVLVALFKGVTFGAIVKLKANIRCDIALKCLLVAVSRLCVGGGWVFLFFFLVGVGGGTFDAIMLGNIR